MGKIEVEMSEQLCNGTEVFTVPGPSLLSDRLIPLNTEGARQMAERLGATPARASLSRWRTEGYPIDRDGPRVRLPAIIRLKKVYTSTGALARFFSAIQVLNDEIAESGGTNQWRQARRKRR